MLNQQLQKKSKKIDSEVKAKVRSNNANISPITDGILNIKNYCKSKYKILWILKEPYDDFDKYGEPLGGDWDFKDTFYKKQTIDAFDGRTFPPIIYTTWGILNDFRLWNSMDNVRDNPSMLNEFRSIAFINVKKLPAKTKTNNLSIADAYKTYKDILLRQLSDYDPEIIIGGNTLHYFFEDLGILPEQMQTLGSVNYIIKGKKIFIDAYHPAQWSISQETYCDDIIKATQIWAKSK